MTLVEMLLSVAISVVACVLSFMAGRHLERLDARIAAHRELRDEWQKLKESWQGYNATLSEEVRHLTGKAVN